MLSLARITLALWGLQPHIPLCISPLRTVPHRRLAPLASPESKTNGPADANGTRSAPITAGEVTLLPAGASPSPPFVQKGRVSHLIPQKFSLRGFEEVCT